LLFFGGAKKPAKRRLVRNAPFTLLQTAGWDLTHLTNQKDDSRLQHRAFYYL
jgi:hypothetical protein